MLFFQKMSTGSPLLSYRTDNGYVGFTTESYILIVIFYTIALLIIIRHLIEIFMTGILIQVIQLNKNNNPYKNPKMIVKNNQSPLFDIASYYLGLGMITFAFIVPFGIIYILNFLNLDSYDIKKSTWIPYVILLLLLFPFFYILSQPYSPFKMIDKYIEHKDKPWVESIIWKTKMQYGFLSILLFILLSFCSMRFLYISNIHSKNTLWIYGIFIFFILFLFIPLLCIFFSYQLLLDVEDGKLPDVKEMGKNKIGSFYELLVKYNYPCFPKE
jgi:hypothetical protein